MKYLIALLFIQASFAQTLVNKAEQAKRERLEREEALLSQMPHIATSDLAGMDTEVTDALTAFEYTYYFHREYVAFADEVINAHTSAKFSFYDNPELKGSPVFELDGGVIKVKGVTVCEPHIPKMKVMTKSWAVCQRAGCGKFVSEKPVEKEVLDLNNRGLYELPSKTKPCRYGGSFRTFSDLSWGGRGWYSPKARAEKNLIVLSEGDKSYYSSLPKECRTEKGEVCQSAKRERSYIEERYLNSIYDQKPQYQDRYLNAAKECLVKNGEKCWDWFRYPIGFIPGQLDNCSTDNLQPSEKELEDPDCEPFKYFEWSDKLKEEFWECLKWKPFFEFSKGKDMFCLGFKLPTDVGKPLGKVRMMRYQSISNLLPEMMNERDYVLKGTIFAKDKEWVWSLED